MTELRDEVFALLDLAASEATPEPPIRAVVAAGRRRRRRAHSAAVGAVAVAVAAVVTASIAVAGGGGSRHNMVRIRRRMGPRQSNLRMAAGSGLPSLRFASAIRLSFLRTRGCSSSVEAAAL